MSTTYTLELISEIKNQLLDTSVDSGHGHSRLLQLVDELKLAVETPTETILRLIYQTLESFHYWSTPKQKAAFRPPISLETLGGSRINGYTKTPPWRSALTGTVNRNSPYEGDDRNRAMRYFGTGEDVKVCLACEKVPPPPALILRIWRLIFNFSFDLTVPTVSKLPEYFNFTVPGTPKNILLPS
ncbi:hypothetical protein N7481_001676 [Penicillium waksmanii]|uniref:uncharacterized protein n=1 Tax=Penicillium waksmanii TaxID=69791 RepID=UPI0025472BC9|nr:uncharacterized protein N7481_001676 [Penicillium waksmanii]KAJ5994699.1 hypothetical protein N7481_001676 [Penicillium waksmanii]